MKIKKYWDTFFLVKRIANYRSKAFRQLKTQNEYCENFYRESDEDGDGRGNY